jgi:hypothetical protein
MRLALTTLEGCMRGCKSSEPPIHLNPSMFNQPKYKAYASSAFFYDGKRCARPVPGTIARGHLPGDPALDEGKNPDGSPVTTSPIAVDEALLARGQDRFDIYCRPCHDERGEAKACSSSAPRCRRRTSTTSAFASFRRRALRHDHQR